MLFLSLIFLAIATLGDCAARQSPPAGALVVAKSGGQYTKVQDAVNALSTTSTTAQSIFIETGSYDEQVYIPARKAALTIYGQTADTSSYTSNTVTITHNIGLAQASNDDGTATVRNWATNTKFYNINIANTAGKAGAQALALSAYADKQGYYGCQLTGFQDTLMAETGAQVYAKSLIVGATDFIFGQHATAWFDQVDIRLLSASLGYITANGRASSTDPSYYVINHSTVAAASGNSVPSGAYYLGRPWGAYARVVFQNTDLSSAINGAGWHIWNTGDERTSNVLFGESGNTGTGAAGTRANFSQKLSSPVLIGTILGTGYTGWVDAGYLL